MAAPRSIFAAAADHSFAELATAIDDAFARWDRSHLHEFELGIALESESPKQNGKTKNLFSTSAS